MPAIASSKSVEIKAFAAELKDAFNRDELLAICKEFIATKPPTQKDAIGDELAPVLFKNLKSIYEKFDKLEQFAIQEAVHSKSGYDTERFTAAYGKSPTFTNSGWRAKPTLLRIFMAYTTHGSYVARPSIRKALLQFVPEPQQVRIKTSASLPDFHEHKTIEYKWQEGDQGVTVAFRKSIYQVPRKEPTRFTVVEKVPMETAERAELAQQELWAVLKLIHDGKVSVAEKSRQPSPDVMYTISRALGNDYYQNLPVDEFKDVSFVRSFAWPMLLQAAALAAPSGKKLILTKSGQAALSTDPASLIKTIWTNWLETSLFDEFRRIDVIKGQTGKAERSFTNPVHRRTAIVRTLRDCPSKEWISCDEFSRYIRASGNSFDVTHDAWKLYIADSHYGTLGYQDSWTWEIFQERYLLCFLFEYAATLGLIDVAFVNPSKAHHNFSHMHGARHLSFLSRYDGLVYFRLNGLGEYCLGKTTAYAPPRSANAAALSVRPNMHVELVQGKLPIADALLLESFATPIAEGVWELSQEKSLVACESGQQISDLHILLERLDDQPLPQQVEKFFQTIEKRWNACRSGGNALLFDCTVTDAKEIAAHALTKKLCILAGSNTLVVRKVDEAKFRKAVHILGYGTGLSD